ncbi:hypothetical protein ADIARSV_3437 [Arcticibacter svalbardensis MN12-7]|uniref:HupE / UreJ protein n=1 Tax=Arcticibacter svalbardensis MN12-7 TaxID=1150600 RepID=R9GNQ5_9SPHI|nr:HupE/UreJ family protein [Arcticibacter svalbardensis]EOR93358.1 hypothetical protein ADIARSV_3437 [Arcticibacter svalbardensis MN12-7]
MQDFNLYFSFGWQHICDWKGYDHILFITALCGIYLLKEWKKVLILITAFTIGHSLTLALNVLDLIHVNTSIIEFLIPVTIALTCMLSILNTNQTSTLKINYIAALFFGLIHGLGFSSYLKSLLGSSDAVTGPLFSFNLGLELGQLFLVILIQLLTFLIVSVLGISRRDWKLFLSSAIFGIAFIMCIERFQLINIE